MRPVSLAWRVRSLLPLLAVFVACGGESASPASPDIGGLVPLDAAVAPDVPPDVATPVDAPTVRPDTPLPFSTRVQPSLGVESPEHGVWALGLETLEIAGTARPGTGALTRLTVAGADVPVDGDGHFRYSLALAPGVNLAGVRAEADDGGRAVEGRAAFSGSIHEPGARLARAAFAHLRDDALDDDAPDLDDVASFLELLLVDPTFLAKLDMPFDTEWMTITPTAVTVAGADVDIYPRDELLIVSVALLAPELAFETLGKPGHEAFTSDGIIRASRAELQIDLALVVVGGQVTATTRRVAAELEDFEMESDLLPEFVDPTLVSDIVRDLLEDQIETQVAESAGVMVADLLSALAFEVTYGESVPLTFALSLDELTVAPDGLRLVFDASASGPRGEWVPGADVAGSLATPSTPPPDDFGDAPVSFAVDDDLVNQILFAYWYGGGLTDLDWGAADIAAAGVKDLPEAFSPLAGVRIDAYLPLVLTPSPEDEQYPFQLAMGDLLAELEVADGRRYAMFVSLRAGVKVLVSPEGEARLQADNRPARVEVVVGCHETPRAIDPASVAAGVRMMVPPILGRGNEALPAFPIPSVAMEGFLDVESMRGRELAIPELRIRTVAPEGHFIVFEGTPAVR